ncbi:LysR family transcriptional regulator [Paracoccus sediminis]|uniref:DNA-binding transcriptional regulator, LysR family n=1 Tax=Paracoccus sediminis TaxID=1214787 RepID=A0A238XVI6_9RHOB|nr:LysR family transcriptional regulator [Paracoccus sediminis]TBN47862.1 LysR family transcriptional regulator [Paracoccus sediminis]SNR62009.1 DNA-binding transcriptional regulator, LysR family [Paracoccus sediminis]
MRLEWLEDILAIAETGSFSGAAERRRLTQSAFSRRIKQIEDFVGVELFDRAHKPIRLKPTTIAQSEQIVMIASALRQLAVDLRRGERITSNRIVIACQHSLTAMRLPSLLQKLPTERDGIYVRLRSANLDQCTGMVLSRQADVAVVYSMPDESDDVAADFLEQLTIGSDRLVPVFNAALATAPAQGASEIPYITYPSEVFLGHVMERKILPFVDPCLRHIPRVETALTLAAVEMAKMGIGIAWVPQSLAGDGLASGCLVDLSETLPFYDLNITATRLTGEKNLAENAFWTMLKSL